MQGRLKQDLTLPDVDDEILVQEGPTSPFRVRSDALRSPKVALVVEGGAHPRPQGDIVRASEFSTMADCGMPGDPARAAQAAKNKETAATNLNAKNAGEEPSQFQFPAQTRAELDRAGPDQGHQASHADPPHKAATSSIVQRPSPNLDELPKKKHKQTELKPRNPTKEPENQLFHDPLLQPDQQLRQGTPQVSRK